MKAPKQPPVGGFANKGFGRGIGDKTKKPGYGPGSSGRG